MRFPWTGRTSFGATRRGQWGTQVRRARRPPATRPRTSGSRSCRSRCRCRRRLPARASRAGGAEPRRAPPGGRAVQLPSAPGSGAGARLQPAVRRACASPRPRRRPLRFGLKLGLRSVLGRGEGPRRRARPARTPSSGGGGASETPPEKGPPSRLASPASSATAPQPVGRLQGVVSPWTPSRRFWGMGGGCTSSVGEKYLPARATPLKGNTCD